MINELDIIEKEFSNSLENIISFIDLITEMKEIDIQYMKSSKFYRDLCVILSGISNKLANTKIVQYNAIIISLYGAYELAIKKSSNIFIKFAIMNNFHLSNSLLKSYLLAVTKTFERNTDDENGILIGELNDFINMNDSSKFRMDLSLSVMQNLKTNIVQQIASVLDIKDALICIKHSREFELYIKFREALPSVESAKEYIDRLNNPFLYINDVVESRNRIAHMGYEENMLDNDMIRNLVIKEFNVFVSQYISLLKTQWCKLCLDNNINMHRLEILKVYNNEIICFNTGDFSVNKASTIFIQDTNNNQMIGKILSIQYNNQDIDVSEKNQNIGCKLNTTCKDTYSYYLYSK